MKLTATEAPPCQHPRRMRTGESYEDYAAGSRYLVKVIWSECYDCGAELGDRASYL